MTIHKETIKRRTAYFIFWSWHVIYSVLVFALIAPYILVPLIEDVFINHIPWHYLVYVLLMAVLPFVSIFVGTRLHHDFRLLMKYFYGFEMPLLFFLIVRLMSLRDTNMSINWLMFNVAIALISWCVFLFKQYTSSKGESDQSSDNTQVWLLKNPFVETAGSTLIAMVGLYFGTLFLIMMLPVSVNFFIEVGEMFSRISMSELIVSMVNPLLILSLLFILFTMSLLIALPVVMIYLYIGQFIKRASGLFSLARMAIVLSIVILNIAAFYAFNQQPQQVIFSLLDEKIGKKKFQKELKS